MTELRCESRVLRLCGFVAGGRRAHAQQVIRNTLLALGLAAVVPLVVAFFVVGYWVLLAVAAVVLLGLVARLYGVRYWCYGAGAPMVEVTDTEVRCRLRYAMRDDWRPHDDDWWDIRLAPHDVVAARMARTDRPLQQQQLVVEVTPERHAELLAMPGEVGAQAAHLDTTLGSPIAYDAPAMRPRRTRQADVERLLASLDRFAARR